MRLMTLLIVIASTLALSSYEIPSGWFAAGSNPDSYDMGIDEAQGRDGGAAATIKSVDKRPSGFGTLMQQCSTRDFLGKRIRLTGYVKSEAVKKMSALWLRVDRGAKPVSFDNMNNRPIKGTTDWSKYELVLDVPQDATLISYGALLKGDGQIWFDDLTLEVVDESVQPTGLVNSREVSENTVAAPRNLDFEE